MINQTFEILDENLVPKMSFLSKEFFFQHFEKEAKKDVRVHCRRVIEIDMVFIILIFSFTNLIFYFI